MRISKQKEEVKEESKQVTEGWVSDDNHSLWYNLANGLAHDLNCDVWINDCGFMELSKDDNLIYLYVQWHGGRGDIIVNQKAKEQRIGQCSTEHLPEASYIANRLVSMNIWEL